MKLYAALLMMLPPLLAATPDVDRNKAQGNPTAPVRLEIFSDFTCPHCKHFHEEVLPQLMKDYVIPGKVYVVDRAFPLTGSGVRRIPREAFEIRHRRGAHRPNTSRWPMRSMRSRQSGR